MHGNLGSQFVLTRVAGGLKPLRHEEVQSRASDFGEPPVQDFSIKGMDELVIRRELSVGQLMNSDELDELKPFGKFLTGIFDGAGIKLGCSSNGAHRESLASNTGASQDALIDFAQLLELNFD